MVASWLLLSVQVHGQGTRCQTRADCTGKNIFMSIAKRDTVRMKNSTRNDNSPGYTNFC